MPSCPPTPPAAKHALGDFVWNQNLASAQIGFVILIVDHLTDAGVVEAARLYESPFTDVAPEGPESLFDPARIDALVERLRAIRETAVA